MVVLPESLRRTSDSCNTIKTPGGKETQLCWKGTGGVGFLCSLSPFFQGCRTQYYLEFYFIFLKFLFDNMYVRICINIYNVCGHWLLTSQTGLVMSVT